MDLAQIDLDRLFSFAEHLIQDKILFSDLKVNGNENWLLIDDLSLAVECATSQNPGAPAVQVWGDLRQTEAGRIPWVKGLYQEWERGAGEKIYQYLTAFGVEEDVFADIDGDLYNVCLADYFISQDVFWGKIKEAYSKGGWPCGWADLEYPNGNLIVFNPGGLQA